MPLTRREVLQSAALLGTGALAGGFSFASARAEDAAAAPRKRVLRVAHLTDIHVQPERNAEAGLVACLHHVQGQEDKPDVIFNGGDTIMDAFGASRDRTKTQWDLWHRVVKDECSLPIESCIGNHDIWGWSSREVAGASDEDLRGKKWALEAFGIEERFRGFERNGWHFIVLDSTHPKDGGYTAKLDEPQFEWLQEELGRVKPETPVCVLSHIPILTVTSFFDGNNEKTGNWQIPGAWMHIDARRIKDLFYKHKNVKVCLSGHEHLVDHANYLGVNYFCNGAVCGSWWNGNYHECAPGYALVNFYDDGTVEREYVEYGWKAK